MTADHFARMCSDLSGQPLPALPGPAGRAVRLLRASDPVRHDDEPGQKPARSPQEPFSEASRYHGINPGQKAPQKPARRPARRRQKEPHRIAGQCSQDHEVSEPLKEPADRGADAGQGVPHA